MRCVRSYIQIGSSSLVTFLISVASLLEVLLHKGVFMALSLLSKKAETKITIALSFSLQLDSYLVLHFFSQLTELAHTCLEDSEETFRHQKIVFSQVQTNPCLLNLMFPINILIQSLLSKLNKVSDETVKQELYKFKKLLSLISFFTKKIHLQNFLRLI